MPSSDINMIPRVIAVVKLIHPSSILDVGFGNGRYGVLFRECFDWNYGRLLPDSWKLKLHGADIDKTYVTPVHSYVYNKIDIYDWLYDKPEEKYDLLFMGDILEHFRDGQWQHALEKARHFSRFTLVVSPNWKGSLEQGSWNGHHQEKHWSILSPATVGGRCLFANSKMFMVAFDNEDTGILETRDICLI